MLFNSSLYIFAFLPTVVAVYFLLNRERLCTAAKWWLAIASLFFYSWWNPANLPILFGSMAGNWFFANRLWAANETTDIKRRRWLATGIVFNLLYLGAFKYYDFVAGEIGSAFGLQIPLLGLALPLGISFFTLTQIAYLADIGDRLVPRQSFLNFALLVLFFPHLIIGPILHHKGMMPQFDRLRAKVFQLEMLAAGVFLFAIGFAKKALIADPLAPFVAYALDQTPQLGFFEAWQVLLAFTCQLYFDFSGYVDMAIGSALMLNIWMPENFNSPLKSRSLIEFWSRWHMTLTNFLTTYIYTPILRSLGKPRLITALFAVFVTFFISGIWHGPAWTFVLFGVLHGTCLMANHFWRRKRWLMPGWVGWVLTMLFVSFTFIIFRAHSVGVVENALSGLLGLHGATAYAFSGHGLSWASSGINMNILGLMAFAIVIASLPHNSVQLTIIFLTYLKGKQQWNRPRTTLQN